nr:nucleotidyltransferase family protein [Azospirillum rugosum]
MDIVEVANRYLVTPTLFRALEGCEGAPVPQDALDYLRFIHDRNRERNLRLRAQAVEAIEALNRCHIRPLLLKGACVLLTSPDDRIGARLLTDLDIAVSREHLPRAAACLARLGYEPLPDAVGEHALAAFARPDDVGSIDLHFRPPGPEAFHHPDRLAESATVVRVGNGQALLPSPTFRALHLIVHDMLHDQQTVTGAIDLRHLCDLDELARMPNGIDWGTLAALLPDGPGRSALHTQLLALRTLFGTRTPLTPWWRIRPFLQHWRRMQQACHPTRMELIRTAYRTLYKRPKAFVRTFIPKRTAKRMGG